ncbi:MAG: 1,4-alpha-glucan branching protein GlgB [Gemmataceae bacterium]
MTEYRRVPEGSLLGEQDLYLFNEGSHLRLHDVLGAHLVDRDGLKGVHFAVWAPAADYVSVIADFNGWDEASHPLAARGSSGIWEGFIPGVRAGACYKYYISNPSGYKGEKADPLGFYHEIPPRTGSVVWGLDYEWQDGDWMKTRAAHNATAAPQSIYELHFGSWKRVWEEGGRSLSYREAAGQLAEYLSHMGFTHVEFMPLTEHPFAGSWGYQTTGYFAPTSRFGTPQDLMFLIDTLHRAGIGVILDWVPSHFPNDGHGLAFFDGTHLYEHSDPRQGFHPDWKSAIFNYGRHEVRSFLLSSALFWFEKYHIDGIRVDAVASMLYLDYSRKEGEWIPNQFGGRENLEAISLLRRLNTEAYGHHPGIQTYAEESTAWPMVSRPVYVGGLGFGLKWDMGWMHDTLKFLSREPIHRHYHWGEITFRMIYAYHENYTLPLSHDEVVHGKGSLLSKMPGDAWQQFANLRLVLGYQWSQPGKKLLFMGCEFGQGREWNHDDSVDWHLLEVGWHRGVLNWVRDLNRAYRAERALHEGDTSPFGFEWIDCNDASDSVLSYLRKTADGSEVVLVIVNFTPVTRASYRIGVPFGGAWEELLNSDASIYGGSGQGNMGVLYAREYGTHGRPNTLEVNVAPLAVLMFKGRKHAVV